MKKTLQGVLDQFHNYPQVILKKHGKDMVRTCKKMILRGDVQVSGFTQDDPSYEVVPGDFVRFGSMRYGKEGFFVF